MPSYSCTHGEAHGDGPFVLTGACPDTTIKRVIEMARTARIMSKSNIYHIMLRGINRQKIFLDEEDHRHFLEVLEHCREISEFRLYAYCLMSNHVHLLLHADGEPLEQVMKRIGTRYVVWYNRKYARTGHLFQDRYKSEPVQDNAYFLTVLRYILNNPVKAGICRKAEDYPWSSASDYFSGGGMTDTSFAEEITGQKALLEYLKAESDDTCMDDEPPRISDRAARKIILDTVGEQDLTACLNKVRAHPDQSVSLLRKAGLSIRQISRLTGLSVAIVRKY